jgi:hypothetical protein
MPYLLKLKLPLPLRVERLLGAYRPADEFDPAFGDGDSPHYGL